MPLKHLIHFESGEGGSGSGSGGEGGGSGSGSGSGEPPEGNGAGSGSGAGGTPPEVDERVQRANAEAAKFRTELRAAQTKIAELEGAGKTEVEKLTGSVTTLNQENTSLRDENRKLVVQVVAGRVGIAPEARADAAALLPADAVADWSDQAAVEKALRELVKNRPYLTGKTGGGGDGGEGGTREEPGDMNAMIRAASGRA